MTKVKRDKFGLYVTAGGYESRPFYGTSFNEGDEVLTHHFGGTTLAGVGRKGASFRRSRTNNSFEYWCTTGVMTFEKTSDEKRRDSIRWYWDHVHIGAQHFASPHNKSYASRHRRKYVDGYKLVPQEVFLPLSIPELMRLRVQPTF